MSATHRPTLTTLVERALRDECRLERGERVLLAVSGGGDSMAMLHVMASLASAHGLELHAHGVNHGLRQEAALELDEAERFAASLGVPFGRSNLQVPKGTNLQARAREQRYAALRSVARGLGSCCIATAHHADDRAETVLIRLMRGSGPTGLGVLAPRTGDLIHPLIRASRMDIGDHLARHGIAFAEDPSNRDPSYLRTRIRVELMPRLLAESPGIVQHLNSLADRMIEIVDDNPMNSLDFSRRQADVLKRMLQVRRDGAEIALGGGWVLKLEKRRIRSAL
jgi:tRNA(Ile)-lysidine synthase